MIYNYPYRKPRASKTWIITEESIKGASNKGFDVAFECDGVQYVELVIVAAFGIYDVRMFKEKDNEDTRVQYDMTKHPLITFQDPPTGDLLAWLQEYAVKQ